MSNDFDFDGLMDDLDDIFEEDESSLPGMDEEEESSVRIPYIGVPTPRMKLPQHVKNQFEDPSEGLGFSFAHRDGAGNPKYFYAPEVDFMVVHSVTQMADVPSGKRTRRLRVGGRRLPAPDTAKPGTAFSVFPLPNQKPTYNQACSSVNGLRPFRSFENELRRDLRDMQIHRIGWTGYDIKPDGTILDPGVQLDYDTVCLECPFSKWKPEGFRVTSGSRAPVCNHAWTWVLYVFPGQFGTDEEGEEAEIPGGLYRLTGHNKSLQVALNGVEKGWGMTYDNKPITGLNKIVAPTGSTIGYVNCSLPLTKLQQNSFSGTVVDAKGKPFDVNDAKVQAKPETFWYQISSITNAQFPEGKPELVGFEDRAGDPINVYGLTMKTSTNNNSNQGGPMPIPLIRVGQKRAPGEYMGFIAAWADYMKNHKEYMMDSDPSGFITKQQQSALQAGEENAALPAEVVQEELPFEE
jgi:hypothetical protein